MDRLIVNDKIYYPYEYSKEAEFEKYVIDNSKAIFGPKSIYIDIKKRISNDNIITIPDGYLIDYTFESNPRLYIIENELASHDPYRHIGQQVLKFAVSYKTSGRVIKSFLLEEISKTQETKDALEKAVNLSDFRNIDAFMEHIIFEKPVSSIIVIDEITDDLRNVVSQLTMNVDLLEFQTYTLDGKLIHKFTPFQQEVRSITEATRPSINIEELDTIIVPANEDGFKQVFLGENSWWAIRISAAMIERIKFIAAYETSPVSAITHYAEVAKIEKYEDTAKYKIYFKEKAQKIGPVKLNKTAKGLAPQAPRYTSIKKLLAAKKMSDVY